ncbi:MAG: isocitrate/isopropylmalate dehydrogenase family protein [Lachnospiraceae bacterium]|nr:isocitrate/isopropylmalate dehydrogenase family protein [Lachnospiraceae bacterium]
MRVGLLKGNGIGPEITAAMQRVIDACGIGIEWVNVPIADEAVAMYGTEVPEESIDLLRELKVAIKGPISVEKMAGRINYIRKDGTSHIYCSNNNAIRQELDCYACPRPARGIPGISGKNENVDLVVIREISEGIYAALEHRIDGDRASEAIKLITKTGAERICHYAFRYAIQNGRKKVTCAHKANAISLTDGLFLETFRRVAKEYPQIESEDLMVDATAYYLVTNPERFDVIVTMNQYGDILSDLCAGLVGSLGLGAGGNIGDNCAVFEACHGSAPDIAGKNLANPTSLILSAVMMLRHVGMPQWADLVEDSVREVLIEGKHITRDIGGSASTDEYTNAVIEKIKEKKTQINV